MYKEDLKNEYLSISQLLSITNKIFMGNIKNILMIILIIFVPINIATAVMPINDLSEVALTIIQQNIYQSSDVLINLLSNSPEVSELLKWTVLDGILRGIFGMVGIMAVAVFVSNLIENDVSVENNFKSAIEKAFMFLPWAILTSLLVSVIVAVCYMMLIIPAIIFSIYMIFIIYTMAIKKYKGFKAISYSAGLLKGRFWKTAGAWILFGIMEWFISLLVSYVFAYMPYNAFVSFAMNTIVAIVASFFYVLYTVWFTNYSETSLVKDKSEEQQ